MDLSHLAPSGVSRVQKPGLRAIWNIPVGPQIGRACRSIRSAVLCIHLLRPPAPTSMGAIGGAKICMPTRLLPSTPIQASVSGIFKFVHHDLWDMDNPTPPNLLTVMHEGRLRDVVAQGTKMGYLYVFDRVTGEPLWPIEEQPQAASELPEYGGMAHTATSHKTTPLNARSVYRGGMFRIFRPKQSS